MIDKMVFNFESEKYKQQVDKNLFFRLTESEKELHTRLKKLMPIEELVIETGDVFSKIDYKNLKKEEFEMLIRNAKSKTVEWERKINAVDDFLTAFRKSNANPKMILKLFFENPNEKLVYEPNWEVSRTLYSLLGIKFISLNQNEIKWFQSLPLTGKYVSEYEIIDPLFNLLDTENGHSFINHLYECKKTICDCEQTKNKINRLIKTVKEEKKNLENKYEFYNVLSKENFQTAASYINKIMDIYWITNLIYSLQKEKTFMNNIKLEEKKNANKEEKEKKPHKETD